MINSLNHDFRKELLRTDIVPKELNKVTQKYKELFLADIKRGKIKVEDVTQCQCGSHNLEELTKIDRFGLPFGSLICKACGLVITSPRLSQDSLPYYYDKFYHPLTYGKEHLENQEALFAKGQGKKIFEIVKDFLPPKDTLRVLEIGAGTGNVLLEFKEEAKNENIQIDEIGTEYSQDCIIKCQEKNINIIYGNIQTILTYKEKFDLIILSHVFEHFIDLQKELNDIKTLMHQESLLFIEVPGIMENHKKHYYNFSFLGYSVHAHMYNFTLESLNRILSLSEFKALFSNNDVSSVYHLSNDVIDKNDNSYSKVLNYLEFLDYNQNYFKQEYFKNNQMITNRDDAIHRLKAEIEKQSIIIENRDITIYDLKEKIEKQSIMIENRDNAIRDLKQKQSIMIENRDNAIRDLKIRDLKQKIEKQSIVIENRDNAIRDLKQKIEKQSIVIENRDNAIRDLKQKIEKQSIVINNKDHLLEELKIKIVNLEEILSSRKKILKVLFQGGYKND